MNILQLLESKGFVQGVDFSLVGEVLTSLNSSVLPSVQQLKLECIEMQDIAFLVQEYLADKQNLLTEDDSLNSAIIFSGGWRFQNIPCPTVDQLYDLIIPAVSKLDQAQINKEAQAFLNSTDYKVLRHMRQQALGVATTLTAQEYLELEQQRHMAASSIV